MSADIVSKMLIPRFLSMCPIHHFAPVSHCPLCGASSGGFLGGFVNGFVNTPRKWYRGVQRIKSQGGVILASKGRPEEEENRTLGQEIRAVSRLASQENVQTASEAWGRLPPEVRDRLTTSGFEAAGGLAGGFVGGYAATGLLTFCLSYLGGRVTSRHLTLRAYGPPATIGFGLIIATLSVQGTFAVLIERQRQIWREYPGTEDIFKDVLDKATKDEERQ
ncbi:hypothetical protein [Paraburkholderia nodosa]|uniref:hypothetical protein n=1 Tax=Paraburkholderia nodosa TaxID=392320 RepID=UPI00114D24A2|nr:hypothetical protein [Paraburkholderia nodosa]